MPSTRPLLPDPIPLTLAACLLAELDYCSLHLPQCGPLLLIGCAQDSQRWLQALAQLQAALDQGQLLPSHSAQGQPALTRAALCRWLHSQQHYPPALFADPPQQPPYLDPRHPRYSPRLALAVRAWQWFEQPDIAPDQRALRPILQRFAADYGLADQHGQLAQQTLEACRKVCNWNPKGGAPRRPAANGKSKRKGKGKR